MINIINENGKIEQENLSLKDLMKIIKEINKDNISNDLSEVLILEFH